MENAMAIVDWVILIVLILSVLSAAKTGLIGEVFSLAGLIIGLLLASWDYQKLTPWMAQWIHSPKVDEALSFILIALAVMIVAGIAGRIVRWSVKSIGLGWADRLAGAAFGLVKGCALVTIAVMVIAGAVAWAGSAAGRASHAATPPTSANGTFPTTSNASHPR